MSGGRAPLPVPPTLIVCTVPLALMLKLMVSLTPNTPGFWLVMSVSAPAEPVLVAWIASRRDTERSLGTLSSAVVVTLMTAGASRCSRYSSRGLKGTGRGDRSRLEEAAMDLRRLTLGHQGTTMMHLHGLQKLRESL